MSSPYGFSLHVDTAGDQPSRSVGGSRLSNLPQLFHVPVFALRELLERRAGGRKLGHLRQADLVRQADGMASFTEADVDDLYENYRYGGRLSFYLYLVPTGLVEPDIEELQAALDEVVTQEQQEPLGEILTSRDYENESTPNLITLLDEEELDGYYELRFRYYVTHRFLNVDEEPDEVLQSRYGFLWLELEQGYLALLSRDESVNRFLILALTRVLRATPLPIHFPKEVLDKHFSIEQAKRLSYYDPGTGVRRSISGQGLWERFELEIRLREQQNARPTSMYDEEVAEGIVSGIGVSAAKGKIYLTKLLPTSVVRDWARRRLPDLMRDVRELRTAKPASLGQSVEALERMDLASSGREAVQSLVEALLQTEREGLTSYTLSQTALEIYQSLAGRYFNPYLRTQCGQCDETAELCPYCESQALQFEKTLVTCEDCGATISGEGTVILRCMNGHVTEVSLSQAWSIAPNHWLQKRVTRVFAQMGLNWDERSDYFHIEGYTLYRLRRAEAEGLPLPPVVQNYISNFWDPVTGQVHAGSGDIIVDGSRLESELEGAPLELPSRQVEQSPIFRDYSSLNLRLRGHASTGYTVEADITGGGSVPLHPVFLPRDWTSQLLLDRAVRNGESGGIEVIGRTLFRALFPTPVRTLWADTVARLGEDEGLRITLHIEPPELMVLPWELLFEGSFLGQERRYSIVRYLDLPDPPDPVASQLPLRVLAATPRSDGAHLAGIQASLNRLRSALAERPGKVTLDVLENPGRDELLSKLSQGYHALHFIGDSTSHKGESYLLLGDPEDPSHLASSWLVGQLAVSSSLCLVVLNRGSASEAGQLKSTMRATQQLVEAGVPAVVTLPLPLADRAALEFYRAVYGGVAAGLPVDLAVQDGRGRAATANGNGDSHQIDWAIPMLTMRTPDGVLVELSKEEVETEMFRKETIKPTVTYMPAFHGPIYGPVHAGRGDMNVGRLQYGLQADGLANLFGSLRSLVEDQAPADRKDEAIEQVDALQGAIREGKPNVRKIESVLIWFKEHLPKLAGAVTSVVLNPIVGKIVEAAGDMVAAEFTELLGR